jgi:hypothetical protein
MSKTYDTATLTDMVERARGGSSFIASVALLEAFLALRQERDALREKCETLTPRALTCDDEWITQRGSLARFHDYPTLEAARMGMLTAAYRLVRVPLAAAEPAGEPEKPAPWAPKVGGRVTHPKYGNGKLEALEPDCCYVWFDVRGAWPSPGHYVKVEDLTPAPEAPPPDAPGEADDESADADVNQLRFIAALGATARVSVRALSACMSRKARDAARMMAVEIAERRLAEMPTPPPQPAAGEAGDEVQRGLPGPPRTASEHWLGRAWIETERPQAAALRSIVESSSEVDTVRKAALALLGPST